MAWDLTAPWEQSIDVSAVDSGPTAVHFSDDGLRMFVLGSDGDDLYQFDLCAPWAIETAVFAATFSLSGNPHGLWWKPDGTAFWTIDTSSDLVRSFSCSTAWDATTATAGATFGVGGQDNFTLGITWSDDGTGFYTCGNGNDRVYEYACSTPWDVSTASFVADFSVAAQDDQPQDVFVRADGSKLYLAGSANDRIYRYSFGTPWDVTTLTYDAVFVAVGFVEPAAAGFFYRADGELFYVCGNQLGVGVGKVHQFGWTDPTCGSGDQGWVLGASALG